MQIRSATEADITAIVNLLKISLGESLMPKSEQYWRWKHVENPFGPSYVLLYWDNDILAGVRAFMRWEWICDQKIYHALRAVDTATHPHFQGKGIFKKLTISLVEICKEKGNHFIFNTPNKKSKPGYLKMGWEESGRLPIALSIHKPLQIFKNVLNIKHSYSNEYLREGIDYYLSHPSLPLLLKYSNQPRMTTNVSVSFLKWRYTEVPVANYVALGEEKEGALTGLFIGRIKQTRLGLELRITDCFFENEQSEARLLKHLKEKIKEWRIDYCTISGLSSPGAKKLVGRYRLQLPVGPVVTIRTLGLTDLSILQGFNLWSPSIGDLELF